MEDKPPENVRARQLVLRADNMKAIPPVPASFHGMAIKGAEAIAFHFISFLFISFHDGDISFHFGGNRMEKP